MQATRTSQIAADSQRAVFGRSKTATRALRKACKLVELEQLPYGYHTMVDAFNWRLFEALRSLLPNERHRPDVFQTIILTIFFAFKFIFVYDFESDLFTLFLSRLFSWF